MINLITKNYLEKLKNSNSKKFFNIIKKDPDFIPQPIIKKEVIKLLLFKDIYKECWKFLNSSFSNPNYIKANNCSKYPITIAFESNSLDFLRKQPTIFKQKNFIFINYLKFSYQNNGYLYHISLDSLDFDCSAHFRILNPLMLSGKDENKNISFKYLYIPSNYSL